MPASAATWPYVATRPLGMRITTAYTRGYALRVAGSGASRVRPRGPRLGEAAGPAALRGRGAPAAPLPATRRPRADSRKLVALLQEGHVVQLVAGHDVGERTHADLLVVRRAAPGQRLRLERAQERDRGRAHRRVLGHQVRERPAVEVALRDPLGLIEARERRAVGAGDPQRAVREYALAVDDVPDHPLHGPLSGLVAEHRLRLAHAGEESRRGGAPGAQRRKCVVTHHLDVLVEVGIVLARLGLGDADHLPSLGLAASLRVGA